MLVSDGNARSRWPWWRTWPALVTVSLPLVITFGIYSLSVDYLIKGALWATLQNAQLNSDAVDQFARDVGGRIQFGIASALLRIGAVAAVSLAILVPSRRVGLKPAVLIAVVLVTASTALYAAIPDASVGKIRVVIEQIHVAAKHGGFVVSDIDQAIRLNILATLVGGASVLVAFAAVALRTPLDDSTATDLRGRMRALEGMTVFCAVFLVCLTALNKTLVDWPQAFLAENHQKAYANLAGAIGAYWGTFGALFLVSALLPAFVSLKLDIDKAAIVHGEENEEAAKQWKKERNLDFDMKSGFGAIIAAAAPILTVPGIDLASKLFGQ